MSQTHFLKRSGHSRVGDSCISDIFFRNSCIFSIQYWTTKILYFSLPLKLNGEFISCDNYVVLQKINVIDLNYIKKIEKKAMKKRTKSGPLVQKNHTLGFLLFIRRFSGVECEHNVCG